MKQQLSKEEILAYCESNIGSFHQARIEKLQTLKIEDVLKRKNPYLFRAKNLNTAQELVKGFLDAHLQSQEETLFGHFLEGLVIFVNNKVFDGEKSSLVSVDLEFERERIFYIIEIKAGTNWGNASQVKKLKQNFEESLKNLSEKYPERKYIAINGCCSGRVTKKNQGIYYKIAGQEFWEFISGNENLYKEIIEPIGTDSQKYDDLFRKEYTKALNKFTLYFLQNYTSEGVINWEKLVELNAENKEDKRFWEEL